ncbi:MAG: hypothetical protein V4564_08975 [Pseudomonadota bacterium]
MNQDVTQAIAELKRAFPASELEVIDDGEGGAKFVLSNVDLGARYSPRNAWVGGHIPALYPYADIYPLFMDATVRRVDGVPFEAPITHDANFVGRTAIQISRRNNQAQQFSQTAVGKMLKIIDFLEKHP